MFDLRCLIVDRCFSHHQSHISNLACFLHALCASVFQFLREWLQLIAQGAETCLFGAKVLGFCTRFCCWGLGSQGFAELVGCKMGWVLRSSKVETVQKCGGKILFSPNRAREEASVWTKLRWNAS